MYQDRLLNDEQKLEKCIKLHDELHLNYVTISMLAIVCLRKGLRLIIENPYTQPHYLTSYWCVKPKVIDKNRRMRGDWQNKPTQYFFIGCNPEDNICFDEVEDAEHRSHNTMRNQVKRSMINPNYANRFIREFIIDGKKKQEITIFDLMR